MHALLLVFVLFAQTQEEPVEKTISRREKDPYIAGVKELDKASDLIDSDAGEAINKISAILGNSKIKHFECRLKIEIRSQEYERCTFYPYFVRARAYMAQGKKAPDPKDQMDLFQSAINDLEKSVVAKVPKAGEQLEEAKKAHKGAKERYDAGNKKDPAVEFRRKFFDPAIADNKFKTAYGYVDGDEGKDLSDDDKTKFKAEADQTCSTYLERQINSLRGALADVTARSLRETTSSTFSRQYERPVPPEAELTAASAKDPTLGWIRRHIKTLKTVQANQAKPEDLFTAATEALALDAAEAEGDNFWFRTTAMLGSQLIEEIIADRASKSATARKDVRSRLKEEADRAHAAWKEFVAKTDKKALERHPDIAGRTERLESVDSGFAVEIPELANFDILKCFNEDPAKTLPNLEQNLLDLASRLPSRVAIESRQELYTKIVKAGALRRIIEGKPEADVIREVRGLVGGKLKDAGGAIDPGEYGPKVKRVIEGL